MSEAPLLLTLSVCLSVVLSVCTPLAFLYMEIVYIIHNDSLLFWETNPPLPSECFEIQEYAKTFSEHFCKGVY